MDWFFEQFVRSTECRPTNWSTRAARPKGFLVRGTLIQKNVPDDLFSAFQSTSRRKAQSQCFWATLFTSGEETSFQFVSAALPKRLLIDPQMTLLCVSPSSSSPAPGIARHTIGHSGAYAWYPRKTQAT